MIRTLVTLLVSSLRGGKDPGSIIQDSIIIYR